MNKELFYSDIKKSKLFSMREILQIIILYVIHYSCLMFSFFKVNNMTYVKRCIARRQYAWLLNTRLFSSHQRLNEEHLNNNNLIKFEQWLVGFTDGDGCFHIGKQIVNGKIKWSLSFKLTQSNVKVLGPMVHLIHIRRRQYIILVTWGPWSDACGTKRGPDQKPSSFITW